MRSFLIVLATVVVIGAGFFAYLWTQGGSTPGTNATKVRRTAPASRPEEMSTTSPMIGAGAGAWMKSFDEHTGEISQEFRAAKYDPQRDGTVKVTLPEARFYLGRGDARQLLVVRGKQGRVVVPDAAANRSTQNLRPTSELPSSGELQDVVIEMFNGVNDTRPALTCTMNNVSFDNDTLRIYTESFEQHDKLIPGDQVPVQIRGDDYDFDGRGLDIHWNERDRRLQSLRIAHGERVVVKHAGVLQQTPSTRPAVSIMSTPGDREGIEQAFSALASADSRAVGEAVQHQKRARPIPAEPEPQPPALLPVKIVRDSRNPVYRASFNDNVRVLKNEELLATADVMHVDFVMGQSSAPATRPATEPAPRSRAGKRARKPARPARPANPIPATSPARTVPPVTTTRASTRPTGSLRDEPVTILWTGTLIIAPLDTQLLDPPPINKPDITLFGQPVELMQNGGHVECASLLYRSADGALVVKSSAQYPEVIMRDADGAVIRTPLIEYGGFGEPAVLRGPSRAEFPRKSSDDPSAPQTTTHASWSQLCRLYFQGQQPEHMVMQRAELNGQVKIDDPQVKGGSDSLELGFAPAEPTGNPSTNPTTRPTVSLTGLTAAGHVRYSVLQPDQRRQDIECARLVLAMDKGADGKIFLRALDADGPVHAFDQEQSLNCGQLSVKMSAPPAEPVDRSNSPQPAIEHLLALESVTVRSASGGVATGQRLSFDRSDGHGAITLDGQPARFEQVDKDTILTGPSIRILPDEDHASINGAGTLHASQPSDNGKSKKPVDVSWSGGLVADGKSNLVEITDKVVVKSSSDDGTKNTASGDRMRITLVKDPKSAVTQPASRPATRPQAGSLAGVGTPEFFKDKTVESIELLEDAQVESSLEDTQGLRRMHLFAPRIVYGALTRSLLVPAAGKILLEDTRQPVTQPTTNNTAEQPSLRGATGVVWQRELRYDDAQRRAKIIGDIRVVHQTSEDPKDEQNFELTCDELDADLESAPAGPTTAPAKEAQGSSRLKTVTALGNVHFVSRQIHFEAAEVQYNPLTHVLVARGNERAPAVLHDDRATGTFTELTYNLQTGEQHVTGFRANVGR
jgi:hypothetical protein